MPKLKIRALALGLILCVAPLVAYAAGVDSWSPTAATNATADGGSLNWAEGQAPSTVNDSARQMAADIRSYLNDAAWFQYGTGGQGSGNIAVPSVYSSGTAFTITGADVTTVYHAGRRVRAVGSMTGTIYGSISSSSYSAPTTTVNVTWDSGSLSNETLTISLSQIPVTGKPVPITAVGGFGTGVATFLATPSSANLATAVTDETGSGALVFGTAPTITLANGTALPISTGVSGLGTGVATFLATPSSSNLITAVTDETGTGALVFATSPTLVTPALGTPASGTLTNATGLPIGGIANTTANRLFGTNGSGVSGVVTLPAAGITLSAGAVALANDLAGVEGLASNGIATRTGTDTWTVRTITAGTGGTVSNGDGVSGNPTVGPDIATTAQTLAGTASKMLEAANVKSSAAYTSLTDATTIAVDMSLGVNFTVTLGNNRTLGAPTNTTAGVSGVIEIKQDCTGSRTLAYNGVWKFAGGSAPVLTTTASARDYLNYQVVDSTHILGWLSKDMK